MLYLDYSRPAGEWIPNAFGGRENLEAIAFLRRMNELIFGEASGATSAAEESTAWPMVSRPTYVGGLGFGYKWNLGWMHDTLRYMATDPIYRKYRHNDLSFGLLYAYHENFILPLSHDEVVHGKGSLIAKMPGDEWQRFANLRAYFAFMWTHPGKKLLFMGDEFAQEREWNHDIGLDWQLLGDPLHEGVRRLVRDLNRLYRDTPALHRLDCDPDGFAWIDVANAAESVVSYQRRGRDPHELAIVVCNFTPVPREDYWIGVPRPGRYRERINTDAVDYGGSGVGNAGEVHCRAASDARPSARDSSAAAAARRPDLHRGLAANCPARLTALGRRLRLSAARHQIAIRRAEGKWRRRGRCGRAVPIRWVRPGTAKGSISRCFRLMPRKSNYACSTAPGCAKKRELSCPNTPTRSGTSICRMRAPTCSTAIGSTGPTIRPMGTVSIRTSC